LRTIAKHKVQGVSAVVRKSLHDSENTVRCLAALALGEIGDGESLPALLDEAFQPDSTFQFAYRAVPEALKKFAAAERHALPLKALLITRLKSNRSETRELVLYYFTLIGAHGTPEAESLLTPIAIKDESEYARELAVVNLRSSFGPTASVSRTIQHVMQNDPSHAVQVRAAAAYASMFARLPADDAARTAALRETIRFLRQYGDGCKRSDREWGWRLLGNSLLEFGTTGEDALKELMAKPDNRELSDRAWRILYLKQGDRFYPITEAEDAVAHRLHPWKR
jgi:HEAT repeat protein